jgi:hypothetical protein
MKSGGRGRMERRTREERTNGRTGDLENWRMRGREREKGIEKERDERKKIRTGVRRLLLL